MDKAATLQVLVSQFTGFLTIAIHTILYERFLYPSESFLTARAYNFPIRQSRHPGVCAWVRDAVTAAADELLNGSVARIAFVIFHPETCRPLERFVWDVSSWPILPRHERQTPLVRELGDNQQETSGRTTAQVDLDEQFRGTLSKLSSCRARLGEIPEGSNFTLAVEMRDEADPPLGHPQPWIPCQPSLQRIKTGRSEDDFRASETNGNIGYEKPSNDLGGRKTLPVRNVLAGEMRFNMWIEEGKSKFETKIDSSSDSIEPSKGDNAKQHA